MKRLLSFFIGLVMLISVAVPVNAVEADCVLSRTNTVLDDGISAVDELIVYPQTRSSTQSYGRSKTFMNGDTKIAIIAFTGTFRYDGSTVSVVSKEVTQTDTYDGWSYSQSSFTSSGGTITLSAKLTKPLNSSIPFTMTLSCDKDGNISYT